MNNKIRTTIILVLLVLSACRSRNNPGDITREDTGIDKKNSNGLEIIYYQIDIRHKFQLELLDLILQKTEGTDGPFTLTPFSEVEELPEKRALRYLEDKTIDIIFHATSKEREELFLPIKVPLLRGILGYRVFLIHKDNEAEFSKIKTADELFDRYFAGCGAHWAVDLEILGSSTTNIITNPEYESLFKMLEGKRFDFFPRGINEAWLEIEARKDIYPDLMVEKSLGLFYYPYPVYYFVHKENGALADRISRGLEIAEKDGSYKTLFLRYHRKFIDQARLSSRTLFKLKNPTIPDSDIDTSWWLPEN